MNFADRQDRIQDYGVMSSNAALWGDHAQDRAQRRRYYTEDAEGLVSWVWWWLMSRHSEIEAAAWAYLSRVYADDVERHLAARDGREPEMRTLLQGKLPGSRLTGGELIRAYLLTTALVALIFASLAAVGVVGGVGVALLWTPSQAAIMCGLWWSARDSGRVS